MTTNDFNGDGHLDVLSWRSRFTMARGRGDGTFDLVPFTPLSGWTSGLLLAIDSADVDGDGAVDVVVAALDQTAVTYSVGIIRGKGNGDFADPVWYRVFVSESDGPGDLLLSDFDGDGRAEVIWKTKNSVAIFHVE